MRRVWSAVEVEARAERIWRELTALEAFPDWNPFIRQATGSLEVGSPLVLRLRMIGQRELTFRARVATVEPARELRWVGGGPARLFAFERVIRLDPAGERTRVAQWEAWTGWLAPVAFHLIGAGIRKRFEAMNRALKERVERAPAP